MTVMQRRVKCPSCTREVRVTEAELVDKRGFCAACDARFDLVPGMFVGDGPNRAVEIVGATLPDVPPSGKMFVDRGAEGTETITVASAKPFPAWQLVFSLFWFGFLAFWYAMAARTPHPMTLLFPLLHVAAGAWIVRGAIKDIRGRDRVTFGADVLEVERRGALMTRLERIPYGEIVGVRAEEQPPSPVRTRSFDTFYTTPGHRVMVIRSGAEPSPIGSGLGHGPDASAWLASRVDRHVREGRTALGARPTARLNARLDDAAES